MSENLGDVKASPLLARPRGCETLRANIREIQPFFDGSNNQVFRATSRDGRQFLLPRSVIRILELFDGKRTTFEISEALSVSGASQIDPRDLDALVARELVPRHLVVGENPTLASAASPPPRRRAPLDFSFRLPLISYKAISYVTVGLCRLFAARTAVLLLLLVAAAHFSLYRMASASPAKWSMADTAEVYALAMVTILCHELGHAAACRRFDCKHGEVGFCLYLLFPALYVNLTEVWRLSGRQRAVVDVGGVYFQLLTVLPLLALYAATGKHCFAGAIYAVDFMVLFSANPFFRGDAYWLLVDLSGIANLQPRSFSFLADCVLWPFRRTTSPVARLNLTPARRIVFLAYAGLLAVGTLAFAQFMIVSFPTRARRLFGSAAALGSSVRGDFGTATVAFVKLLMALCFFLFIARLAIRGVSAAWRRLSGTPNQV